MNVKLLLLFFAAIFSCKSNDDSQNLLEEKNRVVLLKIDFTTSTFEGGKELEYDQNSEFTIDYSYNSPGDFGDVQLYYQELDSLIFDGTIVWSGLGIRAYPEVILPASSFPVSANTLEMPSIELFVPVMYDEFAYYPENIEHESIWNAIRDLKLVEDYRSSNPHGRINLFLYTPSVGIGNPLDWDWYVILKN